MQARKAARLREANERSPGRFERQVKIRHAWAGDLKPDMEQDNGESTAR